MPEGGTLSIAVSRERGRRPDHRRRRRHGDARRRPRARLRAVLHDEGAGRGHRPRARHGPRRRHRRGRHRRDRLGGRQRHRRDDLPARRRGPSRDAEEPDAPEHAAPGNASVLVVEDQDPVRRQAVRILEAHGYAVREAPSGDEALARWEPVDVLVTDVVMPGMSGQQLADQARRRAPALRVVFMSGHTDDIVVRDGARDGRHRLRAEAVHARHAAARGRAGGRPGARRQRRQRARRGLSAPDQSARPRRSGGGWTPRRADRRRALRLARIPHRWSKTLEWGDSSRHDLFAAAGPLELFQREARPSRGDTKPPGAAGLAPQAPAPPNAGADSARSVAARRRCRDPYDAAARPAPVPRTSRDDPARRPLDPRVERVDPVQGERLGGPEAPLRGRVGAVVGEDAVGQREPAGVVEARAAARASSMRRPISTWPSSRPSSVRPISAPSVNSRVRPRSCTIAAVSRRSWSRRGCSAQVSTASVATATVCSSSPPR